MGIFDHDDHAPPLFVPDLTKPAGAEVAADGTVACVACGTRLPIARMDVVGQGYRCTRCSHQADLHTLTTGAADAAANLTDGDRIALRASGSQYIAGGIGSLILGGCLIAFVPRLGFALIVGGLMGAGYGAQRRHAAG